MKDSTQNINTLQRWLAHGLLHSLGVCLVAAVMLVPFMNAHAFEALSYALQQGHLMSIHARDAAFHAGIAACIWAFFVFIYHYIQAVRKERVKPTKFVKKSHGTVLVETLIVMPVFLLLVFGIAQLALMNIAGILMNLALFQTSRVVWLWDREPGVSTNDLKDMAKIQTALIVTPVVPGDFAFEPGDESEKMAQARGIMVGSQREWPTTDMGKEGMQDADNYLARDPAAQLMNFVGAIDKSSFPERSAKKFTFAYHATDISITPANRNSTSENLTVEVSYQHQILMPWVRNIFGEHSSGVAGREGHYKTFTRELTRRRLPAPNHNRNAPISGWEPGIL